MKRIAAAWLVAALVSMATSCAARGVQSAAIEIQMQDVDRFFKIYEAASGHPTAVQLQRDYLDVGTVGLRHLATARNVTGERIAQAIAAQSHLRRIAETLPGGAEAARDGSRESWPAPGDGRSG